MILRADWPDVALGAGLELAERARVIGLAGPLPST
jgi:hypothetical protein